MQITLNKFRVGVLTSVIALATTSCKDRSIANHSKEEALKYIPQLAVVDAERTGIFYGATGSHPEYAAKVAYWDSIISEQKINEAYREGKTYAIKKHNGDSTARATKYSSNIYSRDINKNGEEILNTLRTSIFNNRDLIRLRGNEPLYSFNSCSTPSEIVFWNSITRAHKCREAFKNGIQFVKDSIRNIVTKEQDTLDVQKTLRTDSTKNAHRKYKPIFTTVKM